MNKKISLALITLGLSVNFVALCGENTEVPAEKSSIVPQELPKTNIEDVIDNAEENKEKLARAIAAAIENGEKRNVVLDQNNADDSKEEN